MKTVVLKNPYNTIGPVSSSELFIGREHELTEIIDRRIKNSQPISTILIGGRMIGKSSFLWEIVRRLEGQSKGGLQLVSTYVNFQGITELNPAKIFTQMITSVCSSLNKQLGIVPIRSSPCSSDSYSDFCEQLWAILNHCNTVLGNVRFVVLIDEADRLLNHEWTTDIVSNLRDLINTSDLRFFIVLVITGFRALHNYAVVETEGMGSVLGNAAYWTNLGVLSECECRQLITKPLHGSLSEQVVQAVYDQSGGHPFITQYLMQQIWALDLAKISETDVVRAAQRFSSQVKVFVNWCSQFSDWDEKVYCALASPGGFGGLETLFGRLASKGNMGELEDALDFLCYAGVIAKQDGRFWVAGRLFCDWFLRRHPEDSTDKISLTHRLREALDQLSVIEEAETDFVEPKNVSLDLRLAKLRLKRIIDDLQRKLASVSSP